MTSFLIFDDEDRPVSLSDSKGWLIGKDLDDYLEIQLEMNQITQATADEIREWSDGYSLTINIAGSVVSYFDGTIEAICFAIEDDSAVECMGNKHTSVENEGQPWGLWTTAAALKDTLDNGAALTGTPQSNLWYTSVEGEPLDA